MNLVLIFAFLLICPSYIYAMDKPQEDALVVSPLLSLSITKLAHVLNESSVDDQAYKSLIINIKLCLPQERIKDLLRHMALNHMKIDAAFNEIELNLTDADYDAVGTLPKISEGQRKLLENEDEKTQVWLTLNLSYLRLSRLLKQLPNNLVELLLEGNNLTEFDARCLPKTLRLVNLAHNQLRSISNAQEFPPLGFLDLSYNHFTQVPSLTKLRKSTIIDLSHNELTSVNSAYFPMTDKLCLNNNNITYITDMFDLAAKCSELYLQDNKLSTNISINNKELPWTIPPYGNGIDHLSLDNNQLQKVSIHGFYFLHNCCLAYMPQLTDVNLSRNALSDIPSLQGSSAVRLLILANNNLHYFPGSVSDSAFRALPLALQSLDLSYNHVNYVPSIHHLTNLKHLDLSNNDISQIDEGNLPKTLEYLDLSDNPISELSLSTLTHLRKLKCSNTNVNPVSRIKFAINTTYNDAYIGIARQEITTLLTNPLIWAISLATGYSIYKVYSYYKSKKHTKLYNYIKNKLNNAQATA